ncbi:ABC-type dipeptide/oligopeptide/nickel transport system permease component [Bradyrhizobium diazoefficiens]
MPMLSFLIRRLLQTIPTVLAVVMLVFVLFSVVPGSIVSTMSDDSDPQVEARMKKQLGLDEPVYLRFGSYIAKLATGDFGTSFRTREPVTTMIAKRMGPTLQLIFASMAFAVAIGVPLGFVAALRPGGVVDSRGGVGSFNGQVLARTAADVPVRGEARLAAEFWLWRWRPQKSDPAVTLGVSPMALLARTTRAAVLEIMHADFVRTARSKGMSETRVVKWHVMRNALVLILTTMGLQFGALMGQAVVVEKLFSWPGIGSLLVDSVLQRDIPAVQGSILVVVLFFLAINLLIDLLYGVIDPRIRYA